jgi:hypothetical protein
MRCDRFDCDQVGKKMEQAVVAYFKVLFQYLSQEPTEYLRAFGPQPGFKSSSILTNRALVRKVCYVDVSEMF